jgi:hypothetical protein
MAEPLGKNYGFEHLLEFCRKNLVDNVSAVLRLNEAGTSVSGSRRILNLERRRNADQVNEDVGWVFLHLLEDPRLCDRSPVVKFSAGESDGRSTNSNARGGGGDGGCGGTREQASEHQDRELRRRLPYFRFNPAKMSSVYKSVKLLCLDWNRSRRV